MTINSSDTSANAFTVASAKIASMDLGKSSDTLQISVEPKIGNELKLLGLARSEILV